jgi:hypothetical protein
MEGQKFPFGKEKSTEIRDKIFEILNPTVIN